jgi:hypothetical protein
MLDSIKGLFADGPLGDKNTRQMIGLQMLANSGPTVGAPGNLFAGMPQAVMAGKQLSEKQADKIKEEERRRMIAKALVGIDNVDPGLAGIDPEFALKVAQFKTPKQPTPGSAIGKIMADFNAGLYGEGPKAIEMRDAAIQKVGAPTTVINNNSKLTEGQSKDINFYNRGMAANASLETLDSQLTSLKGAASESLPGGNFLQGPEYQTAKRDAAEFLAVILRKDTGAAVTPAEFELYGPMFLPQPGDQPQTVLAKREARKRALESIRLGLGTATGLADQVDAGTASGQPQVQSYKDYFNAGN